MKKKVAFLISVIFVSLVASMSSSLAWFFTGKDLDTSDKLGGGFISAYFHSGDGSEESPFEITTPFHYENLVKLHYEHTEFATSEYYFRFGSKDEKMPGDRESYKFYATDDNGTVDSSNTATTLNLGGKILPPLGTAEYPFIGHIEGNSLTISNFKIAGEGYFDVGIFGFVNSTTNEDGTSPISNCYWKKFTIDTNATSNTAHKHDTTTYPDREHYDDDTDCEVGYLAGHTVNAASFDNCYVNDCTINGSGTNAPLNTTYGYFGMCENDYLGGSTGKGHNYSFDLDAEAIYRSTRQIYDTVKDNPIRAREDYADYETPINGDWNEINKDSTGEYVTKYPLSDAISYDGTRTYTLNGATATSSADRNYSFSTIGYQPVTTSAEQVEQEVFYYGSDGKTETKLPENNVTFKSDWYGQDIKTDKDNCAVTEAGDFVYYNGSNWKYIHSENSASEGTAAKDFTINLSINSSYELTGFAGLSSPSLKSADVYLYIDGKQIMHQDLKSKVDVDRNWWATRLEFSNISLNKSSYTVPLTRGKHYYSFFFCAKVSNNQGHYSWMCNTDDDLIEITTGGRLSNTATEFTITQDQYDSSNRSISFSCTESSCSNNSDSDNAIELYSIDSRAPSASDIPQYLNANTFQKDLYGKNTKTSTVGKLSDSSVNFRKDSGTDVDPETGVETSWYKWIAYTKPEKAVDYDAETVYLSDNEDIRPKTSESGYTPGYEWKNIDIVGGGVSFYYRNFPLLGTDIKIISLPSETTSKYACAAVPESDILNGAHFTATKYCPGSIVLYFYNSANAADNSDRELGSINFKYTNSSLLGTSFLNIQEPSFKKGSGVFIGLDEFGTKSSTSQWASFYMKYSCTLTESTTKACCYCALDEDNNILGVFDSEGNPSTGFINSDGSINKTKLMQIETYVIALGCNANTSSTSYSAWIRQIDFEYVSNEGYGGTFGKIEYRDASDTVDSTILNFFVNVPASATFSIKIVYVKEEITVNDVTFSSYYKIEASTSVELTFNIYLYSSQYCFTFNGTAYTDSQVGLVCSP